MNRYQLNFRYISGTASAIQVEPAHPMDCTVSDIFEANSTFNLENKVLTSINSTFELSSEDISQVSKLDENHNPELKFCMVETNLKSLSDNDGKTRPRSDFYFSPRFFISAGSN